MCNNPSEVTHRTGYKGSVVMQERKKYAHCAAEMSAGVDVHSEILIGRQSGTELIVQALLLRRQVREKK
jgi:hypothetical protein